MIENFDKDFARISNVFDLDKKVFAYKLLVLFAYNYYYSADEINTDDVLDNVCYDRQNDNFLDGVFINSNNDEDTYEFLMVYDVQNDLFDFFELQRRINFVGGLIDNAAKKIFRQNQEVTQKIRTALDNDDEIDKFAIRIITNFVPNEKERFEYQNKIGKLEFAKNVPCTISFGDDIKLAIDSNVEPFDCVKKGTFVLDKPNNFLSYGNDSVVCNISAQSLKKLWETDGKRGLLAMNLRYYIKNENIDNKIIDSIFYKSNYFWYYNNGIIIVCDDYNFDGNELLLKNFSIVNGGQTSRMIGEIPFENDFFIVCKVIKNTFSNEQEKNEFIAGVAEASNTQKPIKAKDVIANRVEQRNLKTLMQNNDVFIEIKRGEKYDHNVYKEPWQRTKNNELAQDLYSFVFMNPGTARNNVSKLLQNNSFYKNLFVTHQYCFDFLKDVLFIEKTFKEYQKAIKKTCTEPDKEGLVKNGLYYCMGIIGYFLKLEYNPEFKHDMLINRNNNSKKEKTLGELAFNHKFIDVDYKIFKTKSFELYDFLFTNILVPLYRSIREANPALVYSNFTKTNSNFENFVLVNINADIFNYKSEDKLNYVSGFFMKIDEEQTNKNIDLYVDYCKSNVSKSGENDELTEKEKDVYNALLTFRLEYSAAKGLKENFIMTDKQIDKIVRLKPQTIDDLKPLIKPATAHYIGEKILSIIQEHM
ncbi:MAG: AIPR family protein [Bacilli bacterium]